MWKIVFLLLVSFSSFASEQLERRIYYFSRQTELFQEVCFEADGSFMNGAVIFSDASITETALDCNDQARALQAEQAAIQLEIDRLGPDCDVGIVGADLTNLLNGSIDAIEAQDRQCEGSGGAGNCIGDLACNLASTIVPLTCSGGGGTNCVSNFFHGIVFSLNDTFCGIAGLFVSRVNLPSSCQSDSGQEPEAQSSDVALIQQFQREEEVTSFSDNPGQYLMDIATGIFNSIGENISSRFGCARWEGAPFNSVCAEPMSWACADCSARLNMICGTLGYIAGFAASEITMSFFMGGVGGLIVRASLGIGSRATRLFPRAAATISGAVGRFGTRVGTRLTSVWGTIASTRPAQALGFAMTQVGRGFQAGNRVARRFIIVRAGQDASLAALRTFNNLSEEALRAGFRSTADSRGRAITTVLAREEVSLRQLRNGGYTVNGRVVRTPEELFNARVRPQDRGRYAIAITDDGARSRVVIYDRQGVGFDGPSFNPDGTPVIPTGGATVVPRPPVRTPAAIGGEIPPGRMGFDVSTEAAGAARYAGRAPSPTLSVDELVTRLGGNTAFNREVAEIGLETGRFPEDFLSLSGRYHEAWIRANPQMRATNPELFRPFNQLSSADRLRFANELDQVYATANPALRNTPGYQDFRAALQGNRVDGVVVSGADDVVAAGDEIAAGADNVRPAGAITVGDDVRRVEVPQNGIRVSDPPEITPVNPTAGGRAPVSTVDEAADAARADALRAEADEILREITGKANPSRLETEIAIEILAGRRLRNFYIDPPYRAGEAGRDLYLSMERRLRLHSQRDRYQRTFGELIDLRLRAGNRAAQDDLDDLLRTTPGTRADPIDCRSLFSIYPGSFPESGGNCKRVRFTRGSRERYCYCGATPRPGRTPSFQWLTRCPTTAQEFRDTRTYSDDLALPHNSSPDVCVRVDIPENKECYHGPTGATFSGFGGTFQLLCLDRAPDTPGADQVIRNETIQIGGPGATGNRWAPFTDFPEFSNVVRQASERCSGICRPADYSALRQEFQRGQAAIEARIRAGGPNSAALRARLDREVQSFETYFEDLLLGRTPYPGGPRPRVTSDGVRP